MAVEIETKLDTVAEGYQDFGDHGDCRVNRDLLSIRPPFRCSR